MKFVFEQTEDEKSWRILQVNDVSSTRVHAYGYYADSPISLIKVKGDRFSGIGITIIEPYPIYTRCGSYGIKRDCVYDTLDELVKNHFSEIL